MSGGLEHAATMVLTSPPKSRRFTLAPRFTEETRPHVCDKCGKPTERIKTCGKCVVTKANEARASSKRMVEPMKVTVAKGQLLAILRDNREKHRAVFERAMTKYRERVIEELKKRLALILDGKEIDTYIRLTVPVDQTDDYDRVIGMLGMAENDSITLDDQQYQWYVMDRWQWHEQWVTSNSLYTNVDDADLDA